MRSDHSQEILETIGHITSRWQEADRKVLRHIFPLLAEGRPIPLEHFARVAGKRMEEIDSIVRLGRVDTDIKGRIVGLFGIQFMPTLHRIVVNQTVHFSCCALVSQMVPMLIGKTVNVESVDPVSHSLVRLTISPSGVQSVTPQSAVGTFVRTEQAEIIRDVGSAFCSHIKHFPDMKTATEWVNEDARRYILGVEEFHGVARQLYDAIWSHNVS